MTSTSQEIRYIRERTERVRAVQDDAEEKAVHLHVGPTNERKPTRGVRPRIPDFRSRDNGQQSLPEIHHRPTILDSLHMHHVPMSIGNHTRSTANHIHILTRHRRPQARDDVLLIAGMHGRRGRWGVGLELRGVGIELGDVVPERIELEHRRRRGERHRTLVGSGRRDGKHRTGSGPAR